MTYSQRLSLEAKKMSPKSLNSSIDDKIDDNEAAKQKTTDYSDPIVILNQMSS